MPESNAKIGRLFRAVGSAARNHRGRWSHSPSQARGATRTGGSPTVASSRRTSLMEASEPGATTRRAVQGCRAAAAVAGILAVLLLLLLMIPFVHPVQLYVGRLFIRARVEAPRDEEPQGMSYETASDSLFWRFRVGNRAYRVYLWNSPSPPPKAGE
jgi:hypothetical protein